MKTKIPATEIPAGRPVVLTGERQRLAEQHLLKSDRVMAKLVRTHGNCKIGSRAFRPFHALTTAIISQQLSVKAADTIAARVALHAPRPFEPAAILAVAPESLRAAGLSGAKARYIHGLAQRVEDGSLNFPKIRKLHDEAAIAALTEVPGIGRWTAEMFLIFTLKRPDILSLGDAGLWRAVRLLYGEAADMQVVAERWRPYRSVACWYLWRSLDND
ncbi:MAG: DNA-3-methyladenine glycosylase 2 family protein [Proteobacteria bacterium]|nr:DNA-3-methyladenine glycosylase 2 family protein [Pseudomonadota bacterium]